VYPTASPPGPGNDYIDDRIDLNRGLVPSLISTGHINVTGDAIRGAGLHAGDLVLFDRAKLPSAVRCVVAVQEVSLPVTASPRPSSARLHCHRSPAAIDAGEKTLIKG
jgi:hypothetical protein